MNTNIELKDEITLDEYKAWLTGLLRGKGTLLPDLKDWKAIKKMTDKIVPDVIETTPWTLPLPTPYVPPHVLPTTTPWWENQPTCIGSGSSDASSADNITIFNGAGSITFKDSGDIDINANPIPQNDIAIGSVSGGTYGGYGAVAIQDEPASIPSLQDYHLDTITTAQGEALAKISKCLGVKK